MICPARCGTRLVMSERSGIEIDYCPTCRGVWLDRGELDKIIDRNAATTPEVLEPRAAEPPVVAPSPLRGRNGDGDRHDPPDERPRKKKRGGFLEDLFEF